MRGDDYVAIIKVLLYTIGILVVAFVVGLIIGWEIG